MRPADNPFRAPDVQVLTKQEQAIPDDERVRKEHLNTEASLQGIGSLWILGGVLTLLGGLAVVFSAALAEGMAFAFGMAAVYVLVGGFSLWVGIKLRKLDEGSRTPATILAVLSLIGFPIGTL